MRIGVQSQGLLILLALSGDACRAKLPDFACSIFTLSLNLTTHTVACLCFLCCNLGLCTVPCRLWTVKLP